MAAAALLAGCATLPEDLPVMQQIDNETGVTITRLGKPVEIFRETFLKQAPGRFGFIAPFETNHMGAREPFLWISVPVDPAANAEPAVFIDGQEIELRDGARDAQLAGLRKPPYRTSTPWSATFFYRVDEDVIQRLGKSTHLLVEIFEATKEGAAKIQFSTAVQDSRLSEFARRE